MHCTCPFLGAKRTCPPPHSLARARDRFGLSVGIFERAPQDHFGLKAPPKGTHFVIDEITCSPRYAFDVALEGRADMAIAPQMSANDPKRTSVCVASMFALEVKRASLELVGLSANDLKKSRSAQAVPVVRV